MYNIVCIVSYIHYPPYHSTMFILLEISILINFYTKFGDINGTVILITPLVITAYVVKIAKNRNNNYSTLCIYNMEFK